MKSASLVLGLPTPTFADLWLNDSSWESLVETEALGTFTRYMKLDNTTAVEMATRALRGHTRYYRAGERGQVAYQDLAIELGIIFC
jgi:hypothetical protein